MKVFFLKFCIERNAFSAFDANHDGFITREELKHVLQQMGTNARNTVFDVNLVLGSVCEDEVDALLAEADVNKDDKIDIDEFVTVMNKK